MKLFGGKASKQNGKKNKKQKNVSVYTPYDGDPDYNVMNGSTSGKAGKKTCPTEKRKKRNCTAGLCHHCIYPCRLCICCGMLY